MAVETEKAFRIHDHDLDDISDENGAATPRIVEFMKSREAADIVPEDMGGQDISQMGVQEPKSFSYQLQCLRDELEDAEKKLAVVEKQLLRSTSQASIMSLYAADEFPGISGEEMKQSGMGNHAVDLDVALLAKWEGTSDTFSSLDELAASLQEEADSDEEDDTDYVSGNVVYVRKGMSNPLPSQALVGTFWQQQVHG